MNDCEKTGVVRLEDLPQNEIFIQLDRDFHDKLEKKIRCIGIEKFSRLMGSGRSIGHWLGEDRLIRLDILLKILRYFELNYDNKIEFIRGRDGFRIKNPKLPFNFTSLEGVRIIAGILGDGGIPTNKLNPYYTNSDQDLINGYINDMKSVFGGIEFGVRQIYAINKPTTLLELPSFVRKIFLRIGLRRGKKIITNPKIPSFIFTLSEDKKYSFLSHFIDDEGSINTVSKYLAITAGCHKNYDFPNVIKDLQKLFWDVGIDSSLYEDAKSELSNNKKFRLQIGGQFQLKKLNEHLNLRILKKRINLVKLCKSYKKRFFRRKDYLNTYVGFMRNIQNSKGYFTSRDVSLRSGMVVGSCRNLIIRFKQRRYIRCIREYSRSPHEYARYVLNDNENNF